jgi:hypothetical protein
VSEQERDSRESGEATAACHVCGAPTSATDRFCAQCGATLPATAPGRPTDHQDAPAPGEGPVPSAPSSAGETSGVVATGESKAWIIGARPATVIGGGLLLLLLAAVLLFVGQLDDTGTIVMLAICVAPLALLTLAIGIARAIGSAAGRG